MKKNFKKKFLIAIFYIASFSQVFCSDKVKICEVEVEKTIGNTFESYVKKLIESQKITQTVANCMINKALENPNTLLEKAELIVFPAPKVEVPAVLGGKKEITNKNKAPDNATIETLKKKLEKMRYDYNVVIQSTNESIEYANLKKISEDSWTNRNGYDRKKFSKEKEKRLEELENTKSSRSSSYDPNAAQEYQQKVTKIEEFLKKLGPLLAPKAK
jgi:hypothetical protein